MLSGQYDTTILPDPSQQGYEELDRCGVAHKRIWLPCGHYTMAKFPFNAIAGYQVVNHFLNATAAS
jgi:hypothetical protein